MATKWQIIERRKPNQQEVREWVAKNADASAGTFAEAARFGELLVLAVLGSVG